MRKIAVSMIIVFIMLAVISCNNDLTYLDNDGNPNGDKANTNFEYTDSDDKPVEYNVNDGGNVQFSDGYLYFYGGMSDYLNASSNTLMRYNIKTGNITTVCPDPICGHNTGDCPFFGVQNNFYVKNNKVSFNRTYMTDKFKPDGIAPIFWHGFVTYDMKNSKFTIHKKFDDFSETGGYIFQLYVDNYRYFHDMSVYDEKTDTYSTFLSRMDLETGEIVRFSEDDVFISGSMAVEFLFAFDGRVYMTDRKTIYSTDYDFKNKKIHATINAAGNIALGTRIQTDGKYIYYGGKTDNLRRMNFDGTNDIDLGIISDNFTVTEKYIYYRTPDEIAIGKSKVRGYGLPEITLYGSEIRRCNHDGTNNELVYKFEGDMEYYRFIGGMPCIVGNYIYGLYSYWTDKNGNGAFEDGDLYQSSTNEDYNIMRINIETGEIYYIRIE